MKRLVMALAAIVCLAAVLLAAGDNPVQPNSFIVEQPLPPGDVMIMRMQKEEMRVCDAMSIVASAAKWQIICTQKAGNTRFAVWAQEMMASDIIRGVTRSQGLIYRVEANCIYIMAREEYNQAYGADKLVIQLKYASPEKVAAALKEMAAAGDNKVIAVPEAGSVIVYDTPAHLAVLQKVALEIDQPLVDAALQLSYASADDVVRTLLNFISPIGRVSADTVSNRVIISDMAGRVETMRRICAELDIPSQKITRQFKLRYAECTTVAGYLSDMFGLRKSAASEPVVRAPSAPQQPAPADQRAEGATGRRGGEPSPQPSQRQSPLAASASSQFPSAAGQGTVVPDPRTNAVWVTETPERLSQIAEVVEGLDLPLETLSYKFNYADPAALAVEDKLASILTSPFDHADLDAKNRRIAITSSPDRVQLALALLKAWDQKPDQVFIAGKVLSVNRDYLRELGVTFDAMFHQMDENISVFSEAKGTFPPVIDAVPRGSLSVGDVVADNFNVLLESLERDSRTKLLSSPRVLVLDGSDAVFDVSTEEPYTEVVVSENQTTFQNVRFKPVGVRFTVNPRISGISHVAMKVILEVSSLQEIRSGVPVVSKSMMSSDLIAANGRPLIVGGLISDEEVMINSGIPLLKDIPGLGVLFRNTHKDRSQRELVLILTPTIVEPEPGEAVPSLDVMERRLKDGVHLRPEAPPGADDADAKK